MNLVTQITGVWTTSWCFLKVSVEIKLCFRCSKSITECSSKRKGSFQPAVHVPLRQREAAWAQLRCFLLTRVIIGRVNKQHQLLWRPPLFCILLSVFGQDCWEMIISFPRSAFWLSVLCTGDTCLRLGFRNRFVYLEKCQTGGLLVKERRRRPKMGLFTWGENLVTPLKSKFGSHWGGSEGKWDSELAKKVFKFTEKRYWTEIEHVRRQKNGKKVQWAFKGQLLRNHNLFLKEMVEAWKLRTSRLQDACFNLSLFGYKQSETVLNWSLGMIVKWGTSAHWVRKAFFMKGNKLQA